MPTKNKKTESRSFPRKLHALLEEAEEKGFQDLICWQSGGKSFKVLNSGNFAKTIMPEYFKQTKYKSFQRQLNLYGFQRIHHGPNKGGYAHACLIQGIPELCLLFIRQQGAPESKAVSAKKTVLPTTLDPFNLNVPDYTSSIGFKMNGESELNELCDLFRPSDFDEKPLVCPSMDFGKEADVVTSCCPIQYATAESILMEPSADELFSLLNEDDECSEDLQKSESIFPAKLHRMLENAERDGLEHIVSWVQRGTAFKVHDIDEFVRRILPLYFDQTKYESFRRQLNLYEFSRVSRGASRGVYYHQMFVQSDPSQCQNIDRPKSPNRSRRS
jgi:hypothetical protein